MNILSLKINSLGLAILVVLYVGSLSLAYIQYLKQLQAYQDHLRADIKMNSNKVGPLTYHWRTEGEPKIDVSFSFN